MRFSFFGFETEIYVKCFFFYNRLRKWLWLKAGINIRSLFDVLVGVN